MAKRLCERGDLDEPGRWATWLLGVAPSVDGKLPVTDFIVTWSHIDPVAVGKWLDSVPPSELKDQLAEKHAAIVSAADEARAMQPALDRANARTRAKLAGKGESNGESGQPPAPRNE